MLKVLVLSLYNSVLYTRAREGCKCGVAASFCQITRKWMKFFRIFFYSIISCIYCQYWICPGTFETVIVSLKMRIFAQCLKNVTLHKLHCFNIYTRNLWVKFNKISRNFIIFIGWREIEHIFLYNRVFLKVIFRDFNFTLKILFFLFISIANI